jgi:phosphorylcholine metabolism protein LicD
MGCTKDTKLCNWGKIASLKPCCIDHLKELLLYTDRLFKEHEIPFWLDYGTLLGLYRDKGIIVYDDDVDCSIDIKYTDRITQFAQQVENDGYVLDSSNKDVVQRIFYSETNKLHIDIFTFKLNNNVMDSQYKPMYDFLVEYIEPMGTIECWGRELPAPNDIPRFLTMRYGEDYMTPRKQYKGPVRREAHDAKHLI